MKVGIMLPVTYYRELGGKRAGPGNYAHNLRRNLIRVNKNHELCFFMPRSRESKDICEDSLILTPRLPIISGKYLEKYDLDVIHLSIGMPLNPLNATHFLFYPPSKKVVTVHGDLHWVLPQYVMNADRLRILEWRFLERFLSKGFDYFIAVSESVKRSLMSYLKVPENRIEVIYEGIDTVLFRVLREGRKEEFRTEKGIEYPYILCVSNYAPIKNIHTSIDAYAELRKEGVRHKLVIAGGRWDQSDIHKVIEKLGIKEEVIFLGQVSQEDLVLLYNCADLFVSSSLHETFGFPNLEAMACGCPVITTNTFAIPEIVGDAALLLDNPKDTSELRDSMYNLLIDENLRTRLKTKGLRRAQQLSWEKCARETLGLYEKVHTMESISFRKELLASSLKFIKEKISRYHTRLLGSKLCEDFYNEPHQRKRLQWLKRNSKGRILEVGCSTGYVLDYVSGDTGVDIDKGRLNRARKLRPHLAFQYADASNLPFRYKEFDTVLVPEMLEHVPYEKAKEIVEEAIRIGKRVLITVPRREKYLMNPQHIWIPTHVSILENLLEGHDYSISSEIEDYFLVKIGEEGEHEDRL